MKWAIMYAQRYTSTKGSWRVMAMQAEGLTRDEAMFVFGRMQTNYDMEIRILAVEEIPDEK